jgi:hypothetical protein
MAVFIRPKNWPSLLPPPKPETKSDTRTSQRDRSVVVPVRPDNRDRRQPFSPTRDWARGIEPGRGWNLTEGRDHTRGTDRSTGRDRTGSFRS